MSKESYYSEFGYYLHRSVILLNKSGDALFKQELDISLKQFMLLRLFDVNEGRLPSQQIIAERLEIAKSAVSRQILQAQKSGLIDVAVDPGSRRQNILTLTQKGTNLLIRGKELIKQSEIEGFADISEDEMIKTISSLKKIISKLSN